MWSSWVSPLAWQVAVCLDGRALEKGQELVAEVHMKGLASLQSVTCHLHRRFICFWLKQEKGEFQKGQGKLQALSPTCLGVSVRQSWNGYPELSVSAGAVAQQQNACLVCVRAWVPFPALKK